MRLLRVLCVMALMGCAPEDVSTGTKKVNSERAVPHRDISLDLRPRKDQLESELTDHSPTDTTSDGLPWWIETLPDSMRTTISDSHQVVRLRVHVVHASDRISILVSGPRGLVRRESFTSDEGLVRTWNWDVRDSVNGLVPNGLYEVWAKSSEGAVVGYVAVRRQ